jgi:sugar fermentation stimulation protein A
MPRGVKALERALPVTWPVLVPGTLLRRYKRFLADIRLDSGETVTAHCPNPGRMLECSEPGRRVHLSRASNPARKLPLTLELIEMPSSLVVVNTLRANALARAAVSSGLIPELAGYPEVRSEVVICPGTRIDLLLAGEGRPGCLVEVKSSTYAVDGAAMFPDAVTARGLKHLVELQAGLSRGMRSVLLVLVQRMDAASFRPADHIDPAWGRELRKAHASGVEILVYSTRITLEGMTVGERIPLLLPRAPIAS